MSGVEILNQYQVVIDTAFSWSSFGYGCLLALIMGVLFSFMINISDFDWITFLICSAIVVTILCLIIGLIAGFILCPKPTEFETRYEVSITPEVSMQEFLNKYEIIETRGSIYTVREK